MLGALVFYLVATVSPYSCAVPLVSLTVTVVGLDWGLDPRYSTPVGTESAIAIGLLKGTMIVCGSAIGIEIGTGIGTGVGIGRVGTTPQIRLLATGCLAPSVTGTSVTRTPMRHQLLQLHLFRPRQQQQRQQLTVVTPNPPAMPRRVVRSPASLQQPKQSVSLSTVQQSQRRSIMRRPLRQPPTSRRRRPPSGPPLL